MFAGGWTGRPGRSYDSRRVDALEHAGASCLGQEEVRVSRPALSVRDARPEDLPHLLELWEELRQLGGRIDRVVAGSGPNGLRCRLEEMGHDPSSRPMVATLDGQVVGMALFQITAYAPLVDQRAVHVHYLHVRDGFRRRGVGHALLAAAVSVADEVGAEHVITSVLPQLRDTQRFYAQLGFTPVVVRRAVPVSVLRRRLAGATASTIVEHLVARRRSLRRVRSAVAGTLD